MKIIWFLAALVFSETLLYAEPGVVLAADSAQCGDPPTNIDTNIKADVNGKAGLLSKYIGDVSLSGKIDSTRQDIYEKYKDSSAAHADAYLQYQICILIMDDSKMSTDEKIQTLINARNKFGKPPPSKLDDLRELADNFDKAVRARVQSVHFIVSPNPECNALRSALRQIVDPTFDFSSDVQRYAVDVQQYQDKDAAYKNYETQMRAKFAQKNQTIASLAGNAMTKSCAGP
jgi:hypothetical protein